MFDGKDNKKDSQRIKKTMPGAWQGWLALGFYSVFQFMLQGSVGIFSPGMRDSFDVDATAISILSSSFFYSYILMQVPVGLIYDRFGIRKSACIAAFVMAMGCLLLALSESLNMAIFSRILMGLGCSFGFIGLMTGIGQWFPARQFAFVAALAECLGMVGTALFNFALSEVVVHYGWRAAMLGCVLVTLILVASIAFGVPASAPQQQPHPKTTTTNSASLFAIARIKEVWLGGLYAFCVFSVVSVFVALWGVPFLMEVYDLDIVIATSILSTIYIGIAVSSPLVGWLSGFVSFATLMAAGAGGSLVALVCILYIPNLPLPALYVLMFLLGFAGSGYQLPFALVSHAVPEKVKATAMGITNMITMVSAPILQPFIGLLLAHGDGSPTSYRIALLILPLCLLFAYFAAFALKERKVVEGTLPSPASLPHSHGDR